MADIQSAMAEIRQGKKEDRRNLQKSWKGTINHTNIAWMSMLVWLIVPFYVFCSFWSVAVNSAYKLQYLTYIFAVLLQDLSRLSCHSVQRMFLKMNARHQVHKPVKKCNYWCPIFETEWSTGSNCISVPNFMTIGLTMTEIWQYFDFSRRQTPLSYIFKFLKF